MKYYKNIFFLLLFFSNVFFAQNYINQNKLTSKFVLKKKQNEYYKNLITNIYNVFLLAINKSTVNSWSKALTEAESLFIKGEKINKAIAKSLSIEPDKFVKLQQAALEAAFATDRNIFSKQIKKIFDNTNDIVSYTIAANYLQRSKKDIYTNYFLLSDSEKRFGNVHNNPILISFKFYLKNSIQKIFRKRPPIKDLLNNKFQNGKTIVYTFLRHNRNYPGITIVKKPDGTFVKNKNGSILGIPQLAISYSNLPAYIPNGNTPQGIYSIVGTYISPSKTIGPTPNILVRTPFEVSANIFFHKKNAYKKFSINDYKNLIPKSWQNYFPIYQSFYAGKSGRKLIIMHGSTDNLEYYKSKPYYPMSPTQGCLSTKEIWNSNTGKLIESDQVKLVNAFRSAKQNKGFLIVIEIDNKNKPVSINDVNNMITN